MELLGLIRVDFDTIDQLLHLSDTWEKWGNASAIFYFEKACDSVRRDVLYSILIEFGIPMKLVRLIKMC
jgi:hypothetical protein